jgi:hypothetical protein
MEDSNRRKHTRVKAQLNARIKINLFSTNSTKVIQNIQEIVGIVDTKDISIGGMSLNIVGTPMDTSMSFSSANAHRFVGRTIEVNFDDHALSVWGEVVRFDYKTMQVAVIISKVSDVRLWKQICENSNDGISIFPEEWRRRAGRKRRL